MNNLAESDLEESDRIDDTKNGLTSKPKHSSDGFDGNFTTYDLADLNSVGNSRHSTFPSIHFSRTNSQDDDDHTLSDSSDDMFDDDDDDDPFLPTTDFMGKPIPINGKSIIRRTPEPSLQQFKRMLYIQMVKPFREGTTDN